MKKLKVVIYALTFLFLLNLFLNQFNITSALDFDSDDD
jgi:hypothetical protein